MSSSATTQTALKVFLFTDVVGSTDIKRRLGDNEAARVFAAHDTLFHECLARNNGEERDHAGDGFFASFDRPSDAVRCAIDFHTQLAAASELALRARAGIHMGEIVLIAGGSAGHGASKYVGLAVDTAARVMSLAEGGRTLMTRAAFDAARPQVLTASDGSPLRWLAHGPYQLKGVDDAVEICEVGVTGGADLAPPVDSEKARRMVSLGDELTLGWRPAPGLDVPHRPHWILDSKLGEGGFGEVWLGLHRMSRARRVFKFCFHPDRLRGLKREVVLFRLLKDSLGDRRDIASIIDWQFDVPPFFLESEYSEGGNLLEWVEHCGGMQKVPLATRVDLMAQTATALAAAHSVGILHKDIKPANILVVAGRAEDHPTIRLTDFGIGLVTDPAALKAHAITGMGITKTTLGSTTDGSNSGTQLYMAPELFEGKPPTTLSDVYALGVMLYQFACGDFGRAVAAGWERDINDDLLREDIAACVEGRPERRIQSAAELADRLSRLAERRTERELERKSREEAEWARQYAVESRRRRRIAFAALGLSALIIIGLAMGVAHNARIASEQGELRVDAETAKGEALKSRDEAEKARSLAEDREKTLRQFLYASDMNAAFDSWKERDFDQLQRLLDRQTPAEGQADLRGFEWRYLHARAGEEDITSVSAFAFEDYNTAATSALSPDGTLAATGFFSGTRANQPCPIILWDAKTGAEKLKLEGHAGRISDMQFFDDGRRLASASPDKTIRIWNTETGAIIRELVGSEQWIMGMAVSPDGKRIASGGGPFSFNRPAEFKLWNAETGKLVASPDLGGQIGSVFTIRFSADSSKLVVGYHKLATGSVFNGIAKLYDAATGRELRTFGGADDDEAQALELSADGKTLYCGGGERIVKVWDVESGHHLKTFTGFGGFITGLVLLDGGKTLAVATGNWTAKTDPGEIHILHSETGRRISRTRPLPKGAWSFSASDDGRHLLVGMMDGRSELLQWNRELTSAQSAGLPGGVCLTAVSPDGTLVALAQGGLVNADWSWSELPEGGARESIVVLREASTLREVRRLSPVPHDIFDVAFSPDGALVAACTVHPGFYNDPAGIHVWSAITGEKIHTLSGHAGGVFSIAFSPDSTTLVSAGADETLKIWNLADGRETASHNPHKEWISRVRFTAGPEGKLTRLVTTSIPRHSSVGGLGRTQEGAEVALWNWPSMEKSIEFPVMEGGALSTALSHDGKFLAVGGTSNLIYLWNLSVPNPATASPVTLGMRRANAITALQFSPDGGSLIAGGLDSMSLGSGGEFAFWDPITAQMKGHVEFEKSGVSALSVSPHGDLLLTGFTDGTLSLLRGGSEDYTGSRKF